MAKGEKTKAQSFVSQFLRVAKNVSAANSAAKQVGAVSPKIANLASSTLAEVRLAARGFEVALNGDEAVFNFNNPHDSTKRLYGDARAVETIVMKDMNLQSAAKQIVSYAGLSSASDTIANESLKGAKAISGKVEQLIDRARLAPVSDSRSDMNVENIVEHQSKPREGSLLAAHLKANELSRKILRSSAIKGGRA